MATSTFIGCKEAGSECFRAGEFSEAASLFTKALRLAATDEERATVFSNRAACHLKLKRIEQSVADAESATRANPSFAKAWLRLGVALEQNHRFAEADRALARARELDPALKSAQPRARASVVPLALDELQDLFEKAQQSQYGQAAEALGKRLEAAGLLADDQEARYQAYKFAAMTLWAERRYSAQPEVECDANTAHLYLRAIQVLLHYPQLLEESLPKKRSQVPMTEQAQRTLTNWAVALLRTCVVTAEPVPLYFRDAMDQLLQKQQPPVHRFIAAWLYAESYQYDRSQEAREKRVHFTKLVAEDLGQAAYVEAIEDVKPRYKEVTQKFRTWLKENK